MLLTTLLSTLTEKKLTTPVSMNFQEKTVTGMYESVYLVCRNK